MRRPDPIALARLRALAGPPASDGGGATRLATRLRELPPEPWDLDAWPDSWPATAAGAPPDSWPTRRPVAGSDTSRSRSGAEGASFAGSEVPTRWLPAVRVEPAVVEPPADDPPADDPATGPQGAPPAVWAPQGGLLEHAAAVLRSRVPAPLQGGRWDPGRRGVWLVVVLGLLAALVAGWFAVRGRAQVVAAPPSPRPAVTSAAAESALTDDPLGMGPTLQVDVEGRVRRPGLVTVPAGSRVAQALRAAGGALPGTDTSSLDLAQKVTDGQQLRVGAAAAPGNAPEVGGSGGSSSGGATGPATGPVDLNSATAAQLDTLPHIGPATAAKIVAWRTAHGPFTAVSQLQQVSGIGPSTYQDIAPLVTV